MRLPNMAVFHRVGAAVMAMIVRLARLMNLTSHRAVAEAPDLNRVADLADQLAARILAAIEGGELTAEELAEVDLILRTATILQEAGVSSRPTCADLARRRLSRPNLASVNELVRNGQTAAALRSEVPADGPRKTSAGVREPLWGLHPPTSIP